MENMKSTSFEESNTNDNSDKVQNVPNVEQVEIAHEGVLDLRFLFSEIANKWWLVLLFVLFGVYVGVRDMHGFSRTYVASMTVAPIGNKKSPAQGSAGIVGLLSGINIRGSEPVTKFQRLVFSTKTLAFAKHLEKKYQFIDKLYGANFDKTTNTWMKPHGFEFETRQKVNAYLNLPTWLPPTIENLAGYIGGSFEVEDIKKSPYKRVMFRHRNRDEALHMLKLVYREAEAIVKKDDLIEKQKQRRFLEERYLETNVLEFRQALADLMAEQARGEMMSHKDLPSIARIVDPPYVSKYKTVPNMLKTLGTPIFGGVGGAIGLIILLVLVRRE
jgi:hypothetical protein